MDGIFKRSASSLINNAQSMGPTTDSRITPEVTG